MNKRIERRTRSLFRLLLRRVEGARVRLEVVAEIRGFLVAHFDGVVLAAALRLARRVPLAHAADVQVHTALRALVEARERQRQRRERLAAALATQVVRHRYRSSSTPSSASKRCLMSRPEETADRAVARDHAVARDDDGQGIATVGLAHGARGAWLADRARDVAVVAHGAVRDFAQRLPNAQLKIRAVGCQVEVELAALTAEVLAELGGSRATALRVAPAFGAAPVEANLDEPAVASTATQSERNGEARGPSSSRPSPCGAQASSLWVTCLPSLLP